MQPLPPTATDAHNCELTSAQRLALLAVQRRGSATHHTPVALSRIHVHFHPDWATDGRMVLQQLATGGRYLSQFESQHSNGSYSPEVGGQRWQWEHDWFDSAYDDAPAAERPVYGAVDIAAMGHAPATGCIGHGAAPRFGSAYLQLHASVTLRSSFCDPDSYWQPRHVGLWSQMDWTALQCLALADPLDHYVEAQIHGGLVLARDVAAIVLDPSFANTAVADAAARTGVPVQFHPGYQLHAQDLPRATAYRGADIAQALANMLRSAPSGAALTPADLGRAQASGRYAPQVLKKAWHCMARWGCQHH